LFAPEIGDTNTDLLLIKSAGSSIPMRDDVEVNRDPLYRAAATANVAGGLTFMEWVDYQKVLDNNQERIQLVSVDAGDGCVVPSSQSIVDGTYLLTNSVQLLVKTSSLNTIPVQSLSWFIASDSNYSLLEQAGLSGVQFGDLAILRNTLQSAFFEAAQQGEEVTSEVTAEATSTQ
jgi:phosphate transport system substrate-binding protein